ncbi:hypothetical protein FS837_005672 [Tulasnella sp. UAMH 9824]|nr:hypothetical protein FS837_005672 [Tulasnella sp. UAMH 9824]
MVDIRCVLFVLLLVLCILYAYHIDFQRCPLTSVRPQILDTFTFPKPLSVLRLPPFPQLPSSPKPSPIPLQADETLAPTLPPTLPSARCTVLPRLRHHALDLDPVSSWSNHYMRPSKQIDSEVSMGMIEGEAEARNTHTRNGMLSISSPSGPSDKAVEQLSFLEMLALGGSIDNAN